jgi:hypothetical protein
MGRGGRRRRGRGRIRLGSPRNDQTLCFLPEQISKRLSSTSNERSLLCDYRFERTDERTKRHRAGQVTCFFRSSLSSLGTSIVRCGSSPLSDMPRLCPAVPSDQYPIEVWDPFCSLPQRNDPFLAQRVVSSIFSGAPPTGSFDEARDFFLTSLSLDRFLAREVASS